MGGVVGAALSRGLWSEADPGLEVEKLYSVGVRVVVVGVAGVYLLLQRTRAEVVLIDPRPYLLSAYLWPGWPREA